MNFRPTTSAGPGAVGQTRALVCVQERDAPSSSCFRELGSPYTSSDIILDRLKSRPMMERTPASTRRILTEDVRSDMWRSTEQTC